jgi:hypothetical protein
MVRKVAENGTFYHEPPYTEEEEMRLYRHGPAFTFVHPSRAPAAAPERPLPKAPPPTERGPRRPVKK